MQQIIGIQDNHVRAITNSVQVSATNYYCLYITILFFHGISNSSCSKEHLHGKTTVIKDLLQTK